MSKMLTLVLRHSILLTWIVFFLPEFSLYAQNNGIHGRVTDARTRQPLQAVSIFLNNTYIGTSTDRFGNYRIGAIPKGTYTLVFSRLGYSKKVYETEFPLFQTTFNVVLEPVAINLGEITINKKRDKTWQQNVESFKSYFFGNTRNSYLMELQNPEVLEFIKNKERFQAWSSGPLKIRNKALGYDIIYYLENFVVQHNLMTTNGYSRFSIIETNNVSKIKEWKTQRMRAYEGSYRHFLNALVDNTLFRDGFRIYFTNDKNALKSTLGNRIGLQRIDNPDIIFRYTNDIGRIELINPSGYPYIRVDYLKENPEPELIFANDELAYDDQISWIEIPGNKVVVEFRSGQELSSYRSVLHGYWAWSSRISELLPKEYNKYQSLIKQ